MLIIYDENNSWIKIRNKATTLKLIKDIYNKAAQTSYTIMKGQKYPLKKSNKTKISLSVFIFNTGPE